MISKFEFVAKNQFFNVKLSIFDGGPRFHKYNKKGLNRVDVVEPLFMYAGSK